MLYVVGGGLREGAGFYGSEHLVCSISLNIAKCYGILVSRVLLDMVVRSASYNLAGTGCLVL